MNTIKVAIDTSPLSLGHKTRGMGYYVKSLLNGLKQIKQLNIIEEVNNESLQNVDIVHYPYFDLFFHTLPILKTKPTIVTIGDVTPLIFPDYYPPGIKGKIKFFIQKLSLRNIKAVITFSENSKKDIIKYLNIESKKIFPIYLGIDKRFKVIDEKIKLEKAKKDFNLPQKFALFVGSPNWNKNIINLSKACVEAEVNLVIVGKEFSNNQNLDHPEQLAHKEFIEKYSQNPKVQILGFISDEDLPLIYNLSSVALLPSLYEGFGLPILEAQACGVPVITSNVSSMPEVAGEGALYVDPYSTEEIIKQLREVMENGTLRKEIIKKGFENIKRFDWAATAIKTAGVYEKVKNNEI